MRTAARARAVEFWGKAKGTRVAGAFFVASFALPRAPIEKRSGLVEAVGFLCGSSLACLKVTIYLVTLLPVVMRCFGSGCAEGVILRVCLEAGWVPRRDSSEAACPCRAGRSARSAAYVLYACCLCKSEVRALFCRAIGVRWMGLGCRRWCSMLRRGRPCPAAGLR